MTTKEKMNMKNPDEGCKKQMTLKVPKYLIMCKRCGWTGEERELKKGYYCPNCEKRLKIF